MESVSFCFVWKIPYNVRLHRFGVVEILLFFIA